MDRQRGLTGFSDVAVTLESYFGGGSHLSPPEHRHSIARSETEIVVRTPVWFLRFSSSNRFSDLETCRAELYLQPDDYHQVNDVAARCPQIIEVARNWLVEPNRDEIPAELFDPIE
jgi:hypothetical protein